VKKTYNPKNLEKKWYRFWEKSGFFKPTYKSKKTFSIMIPPPNVTGSLHMGHGFQNTLMDIMTRLKRMQQYDVLWQVGTDHAGIATQLVVERKLEGEGKTRESLGRIKFEKEIWKWKKYSGNTITKQLRRLGSSVDWSTEKFTMDADFSDAVSEVFCKLYDEGLIYKGYRLVNWDPSLQTALSDLEVSNEEESSFIWNIKYEHDSGYLIVATTRPETLLGDMAVAVNPKDKRYKKLIGKTVKLPLTDREIPVIADDYVDMSFGTGCLKVTPAHDFNDFEIGKRHKLEFLNILNKDGTLNENVPKRYRNLKMLEARKIIIEDLDQANLLVGSEKHKLAIPRGERTGEILEPYLTEQWYLKTKNLAQEASKLVRNGKVQFVPKNWEKTFFNWMKDIEDWCISRQLWWGHRIPAWYDENKKVYVGKSEAEVRKKNKVSGTLTRDEDVLDTWFSSQLWTFATLGWPKKTKQLAKFHPTSILVTGFDIIFFWVARMIMISQKFLKEPPFKKVFIHGLVRDSEGQKMSKSKGNIIDPIDVIDGIPLKTLIAKRTENLIVPSLREKIERATKKEFPSGIPSFGTDALRLTFASLASGSRDINFDVKRVEGYRNFCNKLWNASRFIKLQCKGYKKSKKLSDDPIDKWIRSEFNKSLEGYVDHIDNSRFDLATQVLYEFIWEKLCDWYIEFCKIRLNDQSIAKAEKAQIKNSLLDIFEKTLKLAHPMMPFITEEIWQSFKETFNTKEKSIMISELPTKYLGTSNLKNIESLRSVISGIRNIRSEMLISPKKDITIIVEKNKSIKKLLEQNKNYLLNLTRVKKIDFLNKNIPPSAISLVDGTKIHIPLQGLIDPKSEIARNHKNLEKFNKSFQGLKNQLDNKKFLLNAPKTLVQERKQNLKEISQKIVTTEKHIKTLEKLK
jgi:valyl-tRNA synthetase